MKFTLRTLPITILCVALAGAAALAQVQPSPSGPIYSRFGLPISKMKAQTMSPTNRPAQSLGSPDISFTFGIYTFPGSVGSLTTGANKAGHIVGGYGPNVDVDSPSNHGFLLKGNKFTTLDYPGAAYTQPNDINDAGLIVGFWGASLSDEHGFQLTGTTYTSIDYPGAIATAALGVNKVGDIVGVWYSSSAPCCANGFLLSGGVFTSIDYPGAVFTAPFGINKVGEIVGYYGDSSGNTHGFTLISGTYTTLDYPGYSQNYAADINDSGMIAGGYGDVITVNGVEYYWENCYIYQSGTFTTFAAPFGPPAATEIWHLNNEGVITGLYADNSSTAYGFEATVGP